MSRFDLLNHLLDQLYQLPVDCDKAQQACRTHRRCGLPCPIANTCQRVIPEHIDDENRLLVELEQEFRQHAMTAVRRRSVAGELFDKDDAVVAAFTEFVLEQTRKRAVFQCAAMIEAPPPVTSYFYLKVMSLRAVAGRRIGLMDRLNREIHAIRTGAGDWIVFRRLLQQCCRKVGGCAKGLDESLSEDRVSETGCDSIVNELMDRFEKMEIWVDGRVTGPDKPAQEFLAPNGSRLIFRDPVYVTWDSFRTLVSEICHGRAAQTSPTAGTSELPRRTRMEFRDRIASCMDDLSDRHGAIDVNRMCYAIFRPYYEKAGDFGEAYNFGHSTVADLGKWWSGRLIANQAANRWTKKELRETVLCAFRGLVEYGGLDSTDQARPRLTESPGIASAALKEFWRLAVALSEKMPEIGNFVPVARNRASSSHVLISTADPADWLLLDCGEHDKPSSDST